MRLSSFYPALAAGLLSISSAAALVPPGTVSFRRCRSPPSAVVCMVRQSYDGGWDDSDYLDYLARVEGAIESADGASSLMSVLGDGFDGGTWDSAGYLESLDALGRGDRSDRGDRSSRWRARARDEYERELEEEWERERRRRSSGVMVDDAPSILPPQSQVRENRRAEAEARRWRSDMARRGQRGFVEGWQQTYQPQAPHVFHHPDEVRGRTASRPPPRRSARLPPGWVATYDPDTGRTYYYNEATGEGSWSVPPLPPTLPPPKPLVEPMEPLGMASSTTATATQQTAAVQRRRDAERREEEERMRREARRDLVKVDKADAFLNQLKGIAWTDDDVKTRTHERDDWDRREQETWEEADVARTERDDSPWTHIGPREETTAQKLRSRRQDYDHRDRTTTASRDRPTQQRGRETSLSEIITPVSGTSGGAGGRRRDYDDGRYYDRANEPGPTPAAAQVRADVPLTSTGTTSAADEETARRLVRLLTVLTLKHRGGSGFGDGVLDRSEAEWFRGALGEVRALLRREAGIDSGGTGTTMVGGAGTRARAGAGAVSGGRGRRVDYRSRTPTPVSPSSAAVREFGPDTFGPDAPSAVGPESTSSSSSGQYASSDDATARRSARTLMDLTRKHAGGGRAPVGRDVQRFRNALGEARELLREEAGMGSGAGAGAGGIGRVVEPDSAESVSEIISATSSAGGGGGGGESRYYDYPTHERAASSSVGGRRGFESRASTAYAASSSSAPLIREYSPADEEAALRSARILMGLILKHRGGAGYGRGVLGGREVERFGNRLDDLRARLRLEAGMSGAGGGTGAGGGVRLMH